MDFPKLDRIASETLLSLSDQLEPAEVYQALIIAVRMAQHGLRDAAGEEVEPEAWSEATMHCNRRVQEREADRAHL